jgi:hypothetical protein
VIITKTNVLIGVTPTIGLDLGTGDPASITDPDHSTSYLGGPATDPFEVRFGSTGVIDYVAISGHNGCSTGNDMTIEIRDSTIGVVTSATISRNNNVVITFTPQAFADLRVRFIHNPVTYRMTLTYVAAGESITIPNDGEQSGYARNWLNRQIMQRVTGNTVSAPIALTKRRKALKGSLNIPNATTSFSRGDWQDFLNFADSLPFFIRENDMLPESSYICFNPKLDRTARAHGSTRALDALSISFDAYNGL